VYMSVTMAQQLCENGIGTTYIIKTEWSGLLPRAQPQPQDDRQRSYSCECTSIRRHPSPPLWVDVVRRWP
jgi:hypothetical protein